MAALRIPQYRWLWIASAVWDGVAVLQTIAVVWIVFSLTGSATWVSLMVGSAVLPTLLVSVPAGTVADAMSRRVLLLIATLLVLVPSVLMLVLWMMGIATAPAMVLLGMVRGVGIGLFNPAWSALFPFVVPRAILSGALALLTASAGVATVVGALVGGRVTDLDPAWSLGAAVVGYAFMAIVLAVIRIDEGKFVRTPFLIATSMGLRHVRFSYQTHRLLVIGAAFGFLSSAIRAVLPNVVDELFAGSATMYGSMLAAFGAGLVVGGALREYSEHLLAGRLVAWSCMGFGVAGLAAVATASPLVAIGALFVAGLAWTWVLSTLGIRFLMLSPGWVRARALGVYHLVVFGLFGLGGVVAGVTSDALGVRVSVATFSALTLCIAWAALALPGPPDDDADDAAIDTGAPSDTQVAQGPVLVVYRWIVKPGQMEAFVRLLGPIRAVRLRTGASEWRSYRDPGEPETIVEQFRLHTWSELSRQDSRYDRRDRAVLTRAGELAADPVARTVLNAVTPTNDRSHIPLPPSSSRVIVPR